jgi:UDP-N-acetyl-2-amino-2-deoxyglucuronate dehydrogenase
MYRVGVIGCGLILRRHIEAIRNNQGYALAALCDVQEDILRDATVRYSANGYEKYQDMLKSENLDLVVIATPNGLHTKQSLYCLNNGCDVLIEKPVSINPEEVIIINKAAIDNNRKAYCVLQVRLNPAVQVFKHAIDKGLLGTIRGVNLMQRWQRPMEYFTGWRAIPEIGGGTLYECGIHYLDILGYVLGHPKIVSSTVYTTKHIHSEIEDTIYSLLDFESHGGTLEVTISAEPHNLECSMSVLGSNGYIKLGGKAMNVIETSNFLSHGCTVEFENMLKAASIPNKPNSYGSYAGSCPNHTELYAAMSEFEVMETYKTIKLIDDIYKRSNSEMRYYK